MFRSLCASLVLLVLCLVFLVLCSPFLFYFESCASVHSVLLPPGLISSHYCELCCLPVCRFLTSLCVIYSVRLPLSDCLFSPVCHPRVSCISSSRFPCLRFRVSSFRFLVMFSMFLVFFSLAFPGSDFGLFFSQFLCHLLFCSFLCSQE